MQVEWRLMKTPRNQPTDLSRRIAGAPPHLQGTVIKTKVWMERNDRFVIGDGGLKLLLGVLEHGSLLGAAREVGWSYRHAWGYLKRAEAALSAPLTTPRPGKGASRGTALTETGRIVLERLMAVRNRIDDTVGPSGPTPKDIAARGDWRTRR
jgi:molybdate transport system regulatory protein